MQKKSAKSDCDKFDFRALNPGRMLFKTRGRGTKGHTGEGNPLDTNNDRLFLLFSVFGDYQRGALTPFPIAQASWVERTIFNF